MNQTELKHRASQVHKVAPSIVCEVRSSPWVRYKEGFAGRDAHVLRLNSTWKGERLGIKWKRVSAGQK